jgi:hypothetical protein
MFSLWYHKSWLGDWFTGMYIVDLMLSLVHGAIVCLHVDFSVANIISLELPDQITFFLYSHESAKASPPHGPTTRGLSQSDRERCQGKKMTIVFHLLDLLDVSSSAAYKYSSDI